MKILAFAASNSKKSINRLLVTYTANLTKNMNDNISVEVLDLNDYEIPLFSEDKEKVLGQPEEAKLFLKKIGEADAVIVSFAEHNGNYTVAYKNLFDWTSRINSKIFQHKPMILLSTSPGAGGAKSVLAIATNSAPYFAGDVKMSISVPSFYENFDMKKAIVINDKINIQLQQAVEKII